MRIIKFAYASLCNVMMMPIDITGPKFLTGKFSASEKLRQFLYTRLESSLENQRFYSVSMQE